MTPAHTENVAAVSRQLAARPRESKVAIRKNSPSHSVRDNRYKSDCHPVDVSGLSEILQIDTDARLAVVEGQVLIGDLSKACLAHGLLPAVVPEYRKFTIAGLINGEGIQSSSHRYGVFTHTLVSVELLQANGSTITVSQEESPEVFAAVPESLGTLGIVTAATIRLVTAKPWVRVKCRRFATSEEYLAAFQESLERHDFHEGVVYGPHTFVLFTGDFADNADGIARFDPWAPGGEYYYQHARKMAASRSGWEEAVETLAYLSRSERGFWWMMECHADFPLLSETAWGRRHMDQVGTETYNKSGFASADLSAAERDRCLIGQDMGVKLERLGEGIAWIQRRLMVYPIWNCAVCLPKEVALHFNTSHLVDLGIYGEPMAPGYRHVRDMRDLQRMADAPSLWGVSYLTWDEMLASQKGRYERYEHARRATGAEGTFQHLREKVVWVDPATPSPGKIPMWRLRRTFGRRWYFNPFIYVLLVVVYASKLVWPHASKSRSPRRHGTF